MAVKIDSLITVITNGIVWLLRTLFTVQICDSFIVF